MKRLNHLFKLTSFDIEREGYIPSGASCIYCGITILEIFWKIPEYERSTITNYGKIRIDKEYVLYNKYMPCLTEDEFIIKNIIE